MYYDYSHYDADGQHSFDCNGHGTHIAGTIANAKYGIMGGGGGGGGGGGNSRMVLRSVKILDCSGYGDLFSLTMGLLKIEEILMTADAIKAGGGGGGGGSVRKPRAVINMSLGARGRTKVPEIEEIMKRMWNNFGAVFVVSAGNYGEDSCNVFPANVQGDFILGVGSTDERDERSYFSNYGECVKVFSPGSHVLSLKNVLGSGEREHRGVDTAIMSGTIMSGTIMSGTSMSAGYITGAFAYWVLEIYKLPAALPERHHDDDDYNNGDDNAGRGRVGTHSYHPSLLRGGTVQSNGDEDGERLWAPFVRDFIKHSFVPGRIKPETLEGSSTAAAAIGTPNRLLAIPKKYIKMRWRDYAGPEDGSNEYNDDDDELYDYEGGIGGGGGRRGMGMRLWSPFSSLFSDGGTSVKRVQHGLVVVLAASLSSLLL